MLEQELVSPSEISATEEDVATFMVMDISLRTLLSRCGIKYMTLEDGGTLSLSKYANWYVYAVGETYGVYRFITDVTQAGVGVGLSFMPLDADKLLALLRDGETAPGELYATIRSAASSSSETPHSTVLTGYFADPASKGAYLLAECYLSRVIRSTADGILPAPDHYATCSPADKEFLRVTEFLLYLSSLYPDLILWEGARPVGVRISDPNEPTEIEMQAVLALYTMDVTFCSFAAEVAVHAAGCDNKMISSIMGYGRFKIADMCVTAYSSAEGSIARTDNDFGYYNLNSTAVKKQEAQHPDRIGIYPTP
jgi:hypothetical protein